jgi:hypothetical protein
MRKYQRSFDRAVGRLVLLIATVAVVAPLFVAVATAPAVAETSGTVCDGQTGGSTAHSWDVGGYCASLNWGLFGYWTRSDFYLDGSQYANGDHITVEMWEITNPSGPQFVEEGLLNAKDSADGWYNPCGTCVAYQQYWADESGNCSPLYCQFFFHWLSNISPSSTQDSYELIPADIIGNGGGNDWDIYLNGMYQNMSTVQVDPDAVDAQVGMEVALPDTGLNSSDYAATATQQAEEYILGTWAEQPWTGTANGVPCGTGSGYFPNGECENGVSYYNSEWSTNVPG